MGGILCINRHAIVSVWPHLLPLTWPYPGIIGLLKCDTFNTGYL